ncbi:hypothetical protein Tco_0886706, partial [Tanacetum coccineum]
MSIDNLSSVQQLAFLIRSKESASEEK